MNVICFGDSNTYGYDPRSWLGGRYDADSRWVDILAEETGWTVQNMGLNGREIPRTAPGIPPDTELLIVMLGHVVDVDIVSEDLLDDEGVPHLHAGLPLPLVVFRIDHLLVKAVLPPVGLVGHDHNIPLGGQGGLAPLEFEHERTAPLPQRGAGIAEMERLAENGDRNAQYLMGKLLRDGPLLIPDSVKARRWLERAATQGLAAAQYALGKLLISDDLEVRNLQEGLRWLKTAAENGSHCAAYRLGKEYLWEKIVEKDVAEAIDYLTQSAAQGNSFAQFLLDHWQRDPSVLLCTVRLHHHMSNIFWETLPPPNPAGGHVESKLMRRIREKKIAMGHKPDDHEEQSQGQSMSM